MFTLASPVWLLALIPWGIVSIWLMIVRRPRADVPFIQLWQTTEKKPARSLREKIPPPPVALTCALLAMLIALIAAARPMVGATTRGPITIIVDRGVTMVGTNLHEIEATILKEFGPGPVDLVQVPGSNLASDRSSWLEQLSPGTGIDSREMLLSAIASSKQFTIVVSNQELPPTRAVQIFPKTTQNVGIARVSARIRPKPEVMVRLHNDSDQSDATLNVAGQSRAIELPSRGDERNYFFELTDAPAVISIELSVKDDVAVDNRAWLAKAASWPAIETRSPISPELERIIAVYRARRVPDENSPRVVVADNPQRVRGDEIALIMDGGTEKIFAPLRVIDHPITRNVRDWTSIKNAKTQAAGGGWSAIVSAGDVTIVAVRENPARQVWIGADLSNFARSPDFVVFFANLFDWLAGASSSEEYRSEPVSDDAKRWTRDNEISGAPTTAAPSPGVYRDSQNNLHALNAIALATTQPSTDWKTALHEAAERVPSFKGSVDLSRYLNLTALALIALATLFWRSKSRGKAGCS